jgi:hypothetical protein
LKAFILLFYTDGQADYPDQEIRDLNNCGVSFKFYGHCEDEAENIFKLMCTELRGNLNENVQTEQVGDSFIAVMDVLRA